MDGDDDAPVRRRRMNPRRGNGGFSQGGLSDSTVAEGTGSSLNDQVIDQATAPVATLPPDPARVMPPDPPISDDYNPAARLAEVRLRASEYEREYRLDLLRRLLVRQIPLDECARQLGISISQVRRDREELFSRLREASRKLDIDQLVGNGKAFYEEAAALAMRAASNASAPLPMRLASIRTGLAAQNDMHRFFQAAGVYDVLKYRRAAGEGGITDIQRLMDVAQEMIDAAARPQAESPLGDFSNTDGENMEL